MSTWVLILFFHVGALASGNSNAVTSIEGFKTQQECQVAGQASNKLVSGTVKEMTYVCVQQTK